MSKYFYSENDNQVGPVTIDELKKKNINRDTMVWKEGMENWLKAGEVKELATLFAASPPPLPNEEIKTPPPIPIKKNKGPSAKVMFMRLLGIIFAFAAFVLLVNLFADFDPINLVAGIVSLILSVVIFKKNKVTYKMTDADKGSHAGMIMGHFMNMGDD